MSVRLEPNYLANVLLHTDNVATIKAFPFVSRSCRTSLALKVNPAAFSTSPRDPPLSFAGRVVLVLTTLDEVLSVRANRLPPTSHVFCNSITEGVRPEDFFPAGPRVGVVLTSGLGIAGLRAFNETLPLPCANASVAMDAESGAFDLSFLTGIRRLGVFYPKDLSLTLPTSVVSLQLNGLCLAVSGTENLMCLDIEDERPALGACPRLRELAWFGAIFSAAEVRFCNVASLVGLTVTADAVDPAFQFPPSLTALHLLLRDEAFDVGHLAPLTGLQTFELRDVRARKDARLKLPRLARLFKGAPRSPNSQRR